jgi:hypothetical protein
MQPNRIAQWAVTLMLLAGFLFYAVVMSIVFGMVTRIEMRWIWTALLPLIVFLLWRSPLYRLILERQKTDEVESLLDETNDYLGMSMLLLAGLFGLGLCLALLPQAVAEQEWGMVILYVVSGGFVVGGFIVSVRKLRQRSISKRKPHDSA